ncbi:MAG: ATP-binding protein [Elusimicrobiota bacterium]|nr:ATP-binding protein [Elusimicrobiota bacterium]
MKESQLNLIINEGEGLSVEFKEKYSSKIVRDIVAFANTKGGNIFIGVKDNGEIMGQKLTNKMKAEIIDLARKCEPSIQIKKIQHFGKIVIVSVESGCEKPYSCSSGYYRRLDAVTQKMTQKEIRMVYKNTANIPFEERSNNDVSWRDISTEKIKAFFKEAGIAVKKIVKQDVLSSLNLVTKRSIKNAGVLLFAEKPRDIIPHCQMTLVAFKGEGRVNIYDRKDVKDDLLTQFNEAIIFLQKHLNMRSEIKGVNRRDIYEIPIEALREAVVNSIIHRDYNMRGTSIMVEVHEDKVVIRNPGHLPDGLNPEVLMNISVRRNEIVADMFDRMDKAERIGTGIDRMRKAVKEAGLPAFKIESDLFFTITFQRPVSGIKERRSSEKGSEKSSEKILRAISDDRRISAAGLAKILEVTPRAVERHIAKLKAQGRLKRVGSAKSGHWKTDIKSGIKERRSSEKGSEEGSEKGSEKSSEKILRAISDDRRISAAGLAKILEVTPRAVERHIAKLKAQGRLKRVGSAKSGHWEISGKAGRMKK